MTRLTITETAYQGIVRHAHQTGFISPMHQTAHGLNYFFRDLIWRRIGTWTYTPPPLTQHRDPYKGQPKYQLSLTRQTAEALNGQAETLGVPVWEMLEALGTGRLKGPSHAYAADNAEEAAEVRRTQEETDYARYQRDFERTIRRSMGMPTDAPTPAK